MIFFKIWWHLTAIIKMISYKVIYRSHIHFGKGTTFRKGFSLMADGGTIMIGDHVFFNHNCSITSMESVTIGDNCIFGENVKIYDHNHRFSRQCLIKDQGFSKGSITIGKNCWLASNVTILKGAKIGDNVVIGAGCTIDGEVPSNSLVKVRREYDVEAIRYRQIES